jgi:hypothetical protein
MGLGPLLRAPRSCLAELFLSVTTATVALASQGPGAGRGTASASMQLAMTILIYGGVTLILTASLAAALMRRFSRR